MPNLAAAAPTRASAPIRPAPPAPAAKPARPQAPRWLRLTTIGVAACIAVAAGFGVGLLVHNGGGAAPTPFSLYLTDAAADLDRLDVQVGSVSVGDGSPLELVNPSFDLAALHGPGDALLVAQGNVPAGITGPIRVHFTAVHATINQVAIDVPDPKDLVLGSIGDKALPTAALLDIDLPASLNQTPAGLSFQPQPSAIYAVADVAKGAAPDWNQAVVLPQPGALTPGSAVGAITSGAPDANLAVQPPVGANDAAGAAAGAGSVDLAPTEAGVHEPVSASAQTRTGYLVHFGDNASKGEMAATVEASGAVFVKAFDSLPFAYVLADPLEINGLAEKSAIDHVERELPLVFFDAQSKPAIRQPEVVDAMTGLKDPSGQTIDGRGIGVAVVDTGIDTLHPDLGSAVNSAVVVANYKVESQQLTPLADTDVSGHGTHVAAIVAGQGVLDPANKGVAPGAKIYGLGVSEGATVVWAAQAFDWILQHHATVNPPIRVVTNSWGSGTTYDPNSAITQFTNALVDQGIVVVFAAGNSGGDGSSAQTSAQCQIPKPGVICVAGYDDMGTGTRDGAIGDYSSRGAVANPFSWPDISAPGTKVMSARPPAGITTGVGLDPYYVELTGTSQAAPHVAAVAALMLQEKPTLTPALLEANMKASAYKFTDGGSYTLIGHYAKGAGLVDAYAAVQRVA